MDGQPYGQNTSQEDEKAITAWLQQNSIPVQYVEAGNGFSDLQPLKEILNDVRVVGLGEATHGTREFFQVKRRLLEFLVTEMAFSAFVLEASFAACQPINDYVLCGQGDRATVLTGQGYVAWDTEEFSEMLDWLRAYNQSVPDEKRVRFYGVDLWRNEIGRKAVLAYLRKVAPGKLTAVNALFEVLAREEAKWRVRIDEESKKTLGQVLPQLQDLVDHLTANKEEYARSSSLAEFDQALQHTRVMKQWLMANSAEVSARSQYMAENLMYLVDHGWPGAKYVLWAHNGHLQTGQDSSMGHHLREKYGHGYFAFGFEFYQGSFQSRTPLSDTVLGDLKAITLPPMPAGSFPWYLSRTKIGNLLLYLRAPAGNPVVEQWLQTPQIVHDADWVCPEGFQYNVEVSIAREYDGIVFIDTTTPTRPTVNALKTVSDREGL